MSVGEYLDKNRPYLKDIINNLKKPDTEKIQLTLANIFISSIDNDEERLMHSKNGNIEIMINDKADKVIKYSLRYQNSLASSEFVLVHVRLLYYECCKINQNRGGSFIDSPDWIKNKKTTINPINKR